MVKKIFATTLKFPETRPITHLDTRDSTENFSAKKPKVLEKPSDNGL